MANPRTRKRVCVPRRAADGSSFTKCGKCGVSVAIVLMDMHDCKVKKNVKRFKGNPKPPIPQKKNLKPPISGKKNHELSIHEIINIYDQPRSAFMFFMESYSETCKGRTFVEINREAVEKWKKMVFEEKLPYERKAKKVEDAYLKILHEEEIQLSQEGDDEAESAKNYQHYNRFAKLVDDHIEEDRWNVWSCRWCPNPESCFCYAPL